MSDFCWKVKLRVLTAVNNSSAYNTSTWEAEAGRRYDFKVNWATGWGFALPQRNLKEKIFTFRIWNCWEGLTETPRTKRLSHYLYQERRSSSPLGGSLRCWSSRCPRVYTLSHHRWNLTKANREWETMSRNPWNLVLFKLEDSQNDLFQKKKDTNMYEPYLGAGHKYMH